MIMADVRQYNFTHKEIIEALIVKQGITEGCWALAVNFGLGATTAGPTPEESHPTAFVSVTGLGLLQVEPGTPGTYIDASTFRTKISNKTKSKKS
jgi:hypothetical protein